MITIEQQPSELNPVYNGLNYVVSTDNFSQPNFKFLCDIYINGTYVKRMKRPAHPDFPSALFDTHRIVESFITDNISTNAVDGFYNNSESFCTIQCKFGEEYGLDSSGVTDYPDLSNSNTVYAFNAAINSLDFTSWDGGDYTLDSSGSLFLHPFPIFYNGMRGSVIMRNQSLFAYLYYNTNLDIDKMVIITYDSDRNFIEEYQIENNIAFATSRFLRCPIGYNANDIDAGIFATGTPPVLTDAVKYFKVYTVDNLNSPTSESLYFEISDDCTVYESFEMFWLNPLGGVDTFVFNNVSNETIKIDKKEYKQDVGILAADSFTLAKSDRGFQNYFTSSNSELKIKTGWITENIFSYLKYIKESPQVFINDSGTLIAVNVTDTSYEVRKTVNGQLINIELTLKYSVNNYRQRY